MIYFLVGHRGVGKSRFLERISEYYKGLSTPVQTFDLDAEIEKSTGQTIADIFSNMGEVGFRNIENKIFSEVIEKCMCSRGIQFVALGAGYMGPLPEGARVIWLRRATDRLGRVFVDRPRFDDAITPLAEFIQRFDQREARYRQIAHKEITLSEGWDFVNDVEPVLLNLRPALLKGAITLLPYHIKNPERFETHLTDWLQWGVEFIELRDDLLSEAQIAELLKLIPAEKTLISFRRKDTSASLIKLAGSYKTDWAVELGQSPFLHNFAVSLHERLTDETVEESMERLLEHKADHHKLALPIDTFVELWAGHRFFLDGPDRRSFLPRSQNGRWRWYRLQQKNKMKLNFVTSGEGSSPDQPTFFDYIQHPSQTEGFAAVLGEPIQHSHTPAEQSAFFNERKMGVVAIQMNDEECNSLNFSILERLGLKAAAVTSPLKKKIVQFCSFVEEEAAHLNSVNTVIKSPSGWQGTNTDIEGLRSIFGQWDLADEIVVWGGGGTRMALKSILANAHFFSARRGEEIWVTEKKPLQPEAVVWALGRNRMEKTLPPPAQWRPQYVFDLNYSEDSPGLEYALQTGAKYISGKAMFKAQAKAQRAYWAQRFVE